MFLSMGKVDVRLSDAYTITFQVSYLINERSYVYGIGLFKGADCLIHSWLCLLVFPFPTIYAHFAGDDIVFRALLAILFNPLANVSDLDELLEGTINWRARLHALVEIDRGDSTLGNTLWSELEFLPNVSEHEITGIGNN